MGLKPQEFISCSSGAWTSKIKAMAGLVSSEASWLIDSQLLAVSSHGLYSVPSQEERSGVSTSSYKDTSPIRSRPTLTTSFNCNYPPKCPISKRSSILRHWRLGLQHMNFKGDNSVHNRHEWLARGPGYEPYFSMLLVPETRK